MNDRLAPSDRNAAPYRHRRDPNSGERWMDISIRGARVLDSPLLNKGTAFTEEERDALGIRGLLPPGLQTLEQQVERVIFNSNQKPSPLERYIHLMSVLDRNETLFYRAVLDRVMEYLPIIYTPTVGQACQQFGRIYRRARGLYLTVDDTNRMDQVLANCPNQDLEIIVVTDGARILGLGDLGAGGMGISIGKISLYVTGAGINPGRTLPVCLDVGTDNAALRDDPLYLGRRVPRERGEAYDRLVDAFMAAVAKRFPRAIVQFEDFAKGNAERLLKRHQNNYRCFNDDIQGTGAVTFAGVLSALKISGERIQDQRVIITGAGSAGVGIARLLKGAQIWMFDSKGLITTDRDKVMDEQKEFARREPGGSILEVAKRMNPTMLIGVSGQAGLFSKELLETMSSARRPIIFPLSNPTANSEGIPAEIMEITGGRAIVASGSPFPNTAQCNNMYIFPGVGLGVIASGARRVNDDLFRAAAERLASLAPAGQIFPPLSAIRSISREIALAVGRAAIEKGLAEPMDDKVLAARIDEEVWDPKYIPYRAV